MKKFHFRLDKLLMLREFEEYKEKLKLGKINEQIFEVERHIQTLYDDISEFYKIQDKNGEIVSKGSDYFAYAFSIQAARSHIEKLKKELAKLRKDYDRQLEQMLDKRNKVKMLEKLQADELKSFKHDEMNKQANTISDIIGARLNRGDQVDEV